MKKGRCNECGAVLRDGPNFCGQCGARQTPAREARIEPVIVSQLGADESDLAELMRSHGQVMTCPACGELTAAGSECCRNCGRMLQAGAEEPSGQRQAPTTMEEDITPYAPSATVQAAGRMEQPPAQRGRRAYGFAAAVVLLAGLGVAAGYWLRPAIDASLLPQMMVKAPAISTPAVAAPQAAQAAPVAAQAAAATPVAPAPAAPVPLPQPRAADTSAPVAIAEIPPSAAPQRRAAETAAAPRAAPQGQPAAALPAPTPPRTVQGAESRAAAPASMERETQASPPPAVSKPLRAQERSDVATREAGEKPKPREVLEYSDGNSMHRTVVEQNGQLTRTECSRGMFGWVCREVRGPEG